MNRFVFLLLLAGCPEPELYEGAFDLPTAAGVLPVEQGPFKEPIAYVSNGVGGLVNNIALKSGNFLVQDPTAAYLDGHALPTGAARSLSSVAAWGNGVSTAAIVGDRRYGQILAVPHIVDVVDGVPVEWVDQFEAEMLVGEPTFIDADGTGDSASITGLEAKAGWTSTETWTFTFNGVEWDVEGSRSGRQEFAALPGQAWWADRRALTGTIEGSATAGDQLLVTTSNGIIEVDANGVPTALLALPDGSSIAAIIDDITLDHATLQWFDPISLTLSPSTLPDFAQPSRPALSEDGLDLFVGDLAAPAVWRVPLDGSAAVAIPVPWPVSDVAQLDGNDGIRRLFVVPAGLGELWVLNLANFELIDMQPFLVGTQGIALGSVIAGIDAVPLAYAYPLANDEGDRPIRRSVAVTTYAGRMLFLEEKTTCMVSDVIGPRTALLDSFDDHPDYTTNYDGIEFSPYLETDLASGRSALVNSCGGIARGESWTLIFDRINQGWTVDGSFSGLQSALAREDERYLSDDGAISFVIRSGAVPSEDGFVITFTVLEGILAVTGDNDGDGLREVSLDNPADPVFFHYFAGEGDGTDRAMVLSIAQSGDAVGRVDPQDGIVEASWR